MFLILFSAAGVAVRLKVMREGDYHKELAVAICNRLHDWLQMQSDTAVLVHGDVSRNLDFGLQRLRDEPNEGLAMVRPLRLNTDGTLQVERLHDGAELTLAAEYLW